MLLIFESLLIDKVKGLFKGKKIKLKEILDNNVENVNLDYVNRNKNRRYLVELSDLIKANVFNSNDVAEFVNKNKWVKYSMSEDYKTWIASVDKFVRDIEEDDDDGSNKEQIKNIKNHVKEIKKKLLLQVYLTDFVDYEDILFIGKDMAVYQTNIWNHSINKISDSWEEFITEIEFENVYDIIIKGD